MFDLNRFFQGKNIDFIRIVNIQTIPFAKEKGFMHAVLFGVSLSTNYIKKAMSSSSYVTDLIHIGEIEEDEFHIKEKLTDDLADDLEKNLRQEGYDALSCSERSIEAIGIYNNKTKTSQIPHKTLAIKAGLGWIGKNNLLVTPDFGCAISMCAVLTNAPMRNDEFAELNSKCESCCLCVEACPENVLSGKKWDKNTHRDEIIDVHNCKTCLQCIVHCKYTMKYTTGELSKKVSTL